MPDIIVIWETHVGNQGSPPEIYGYKHFENNHTNRSSGTALYYRLFSKAEQLQHPAEANQELKSRITMAKINNTWIAECYAPVSSANEETREEFYAYVAEAITAMR